MRHQFTAILEQDGEWVIGYCPEVPGANGQGYTREECMKSLAEGRVPYPRGPFGRRASRYSARRHP